MKNYKEFVNEDSNLSKSEKGLGRFGMLDKTKYPEDFLSFLKNNKFKKAIKAYHLDNVIRDQVYDKNRTYKDYIIELECYIHEDSNIGLTVFIEKNDMYMYYFIEYDWFESDKIIQHIEELNIDLYLDIIEKNIDIHGKITDIIGNIGAKNYDVTLKL